MKILFFSDLHAHNHEQFATTLPNGRNSRFQDILNVLEQIETICVEEHIDAVVFCGDVFHSRKNVDVGVYVETYDAFQRIRDAVDEMVVLVGNHDQHTKVGDIHALIPFANFARIVDGWSTFELATANDIVTITASPFTADVATLREKIAAMEPCDIFCFHQGLSEAAVGAFDVYVKAEMSVRDLPLTKARLCLGGHYHKHQWLSADGSACRVGYVGSPLQLSFGERFESKVVLVVDTRDYSVTERPTSAPSFLECSAAELEEVCKKTGADPGYDFIRVRGTEQDCSRAKSAYPRLLVEVEEPTTEVVTRIPEAAVYDDGLLIQSYVEQRAGPLDKDRLIKLGRELLIGESDD